jgi:hypothetical protein
MNKKKQFKSPTILQNVEVCLERDILQGSLGPDMRVNSMAQEVNTLDYESGDYTAEWN